MVESVVGWGQCLQQGSSAGAAAVGAGVELVGAGVAVLTDQAVPLDWSSEVDHAINIQEHE